MRADRLVAATLYLQRRGRVTATELAEHLEVSVATARRDLEALSAAGIPVYSQPGRGGGWQLVGGARTDLSGLTRPEVRALFLALASDSGGASMQTALAKVVQALPEPFREDADLASSARRRDPMRWEHRRAPVPPQVRALQEAVLRRRACEISYRARSEPQARRRLVHPWRLVDKAGTFYLLAGTERGPRTYRVDRIDAVTVRDLVPERPSDSELDEYWQRTVETVERARTGVRARIRADEQALAVLADQFGDSFARDGDEAVVAAHSERGLAEKLAGWGRRVEVVDHPGVRAELSAIGAELVAAYR